MQEVTGRVKNVLSDRLALIKGMLGSSPFLNVAKTGEYNPLYFVHTVLFCIIYVCTQESVRAESFCTVIRIQKYRLFLL